MNYRAIHDRIIERARLRGRPDGYYERHHVIPRCMGGQHRPSNIVKLTPEEHYVVHQLLVKMYPKKRTLAVAAVHMARRCSGNKAYGWLKRRQALAMMGNTIWLGRKHTEKTKALKRALTLGRKMPREGVEKVAAKKRGVPLTLEHRAKIAAANRGKIRTPEQRARMSAAFIGRRITESQRKAVSEASRGRVITEQERRNRSLAQMGKKRGPTPQWVRDKISAGHLKRLAMARQQAGGQTGLLRDDAFALGVHQSAPASHH